MKRTSRRPRCQGGAMKAGARYWVMVAVLLGATTGMAYLSHGESTPPAKPLAEFPDQIGTYIKVSTGRWTKRRWTS